MTIEEQVPLAHLTTLRVGGPARYVIMCLTDEDVLAGVAFAREHRLPLIVLGGGSNVLASDEPYSGVVLVMKTEGIREVAQTDHYLEYAVSAGVSWDDFVQYVAERGLWGIENLAGIPGSTGATPVQNIGAYGMDVSQTISRVSVYDVETNAKTTIEAGECQFAYRDSRFKREPNLIILEVVFRLQIHGEPRIGYPDLRKAQEEGVPLSTPKDIAAAVRIIRSYKFPDLRLFGTAGSFFKNPILTQEQFSKLSATYGAIPSFPHPDGVKIPLAFILDHVLSLKGYKKGNTFLFGNQPLVVVADLGATATEIELLAQEIEEKVFDATHIRIEREVTHFSSHEI